MDIDKEVEKYEKKKAKLLGSLLGRLNNRSIEKGRDVQRINNAMHDLNEQKEVNLSEMKKISLVINKLSK